MFSRQSFAPWCVTRCVPASRALAVLVVGFVCGSALADSDVPNDRTVVEVSTFETSAIISFSPSYANGEGCTGQNESSRVVIEWSLSSEYRMLLTAAISALHAGSQVGFGLSGCSLEHSLPLVYRIDVRP